MTAQEVVDLFTYLAEENRELSDTLRSEYMQGYCAGKSDAYNLAAKQVFDALVADARVEAR